MATRALEATSLEEMIGVLPALADRVVTLCVESPLAIATPQCHVVGYELDDGDLDAQDEPWVPSGYEYLLEADIALEAADGIGGGTQQAASAARARAAAVIYYATFDAWLPVGDERRPTGGMAQWGRSASAAAAANLQSASERLARFPADPMPSRADQWSVRVGDVVGVMVWFAGPDGPRPDLRRVHIDNIDGDFLTARAVDADVRLEFRHDHIVEVDR